jgi:hypothetical protein
MSDEDCNKAIPAKALPPRAIRFYVIQRVTGNGFFEFELENCPLISVEKPLKNA